MAIFRKNFKKTVWGYITVKADTEAQAEWKFDAAEHDEHDNKSEYEFEEWEKE